MSRTRRSLRRFLLLRCASDDSFSTSPAIFSLNSLSVIKPSTRHGARHGRYTVPTSALFAVIFLLRSLALLLQRYRIDHTSSPSSFTFELQSALSSCIRLPSLIFCNITTLKEASKMGMKAYPVIDLIATGNNIRRLRMERGLTVRELQSYFGFEEPRAIYKWQKGESLPTVDNLYALGVLFEVPIDQILVPVIKLHIVSEQQAESCCSHHFLPGYFGYGERPMQLPPFAPSALPAA